MELMAKILAGFGLTLLAMLWFADYQQPKKP